LPGIEGLTSIIHRQVGDQRQYSENPVPDRKRVFCTASIERDDDGTGREEQRVAVWFGMDRCLCTDRAWGAALVLHECRLLQVACEIVCDQPAQHVSHA